MLLKKYVQKTSSLKHKYKLSTNPKNISLDNLVELKKEVKEKIKELDVLLSSNNPSISKIDISDERYHYNILLGKISEEIIKKKRAILKMNKKALNAGGVYIYDGSTSSTNLSGISL